MRRLTFAEVEREWMERTGPKPDIAVYVHRRLIDGWPKTAALRETDDDGHDDAPRPVATPGLPTVADDGSR